MIRLITLMMIAFLPLNSQAGDGTPATASALQGTWTLIEQQIDGKPNSNAFKHYELTFDGEFLSLAYETADGAASLGRNKYRFTLNSASKPNQLTWFDEKLLIQAVFELNGDSLSIAHFGRPEIDRPDSLDHYKTSRSIKSSLTKWSLKRKVGATPAPSGKDVH